jgi:tRNA(Arg) A34 adenosine deaminase TadA
MEICFKNISELVKGGLIPLSIRGYEDGTGDGMSEKNLKAADARHVKSLSSPDSHKRRIFYSKRGFWKRFPAGVALMLIVGLFIFTSPIPGYAEGGENGLTPEDIKFLNMAIELAGQSVKAGNHPFGAVVAKDGKLVARGMNQVLTKKEEFLHAEIVALNAAYQKLGKKGLEGATLYTSCEPCPMCSGAVYISGISRVVYALSCEKLGTILHNDSFCMSARRVLELGERQISVQGPFMEDIAARPFYEFLEKWKKKDAAN